MSDSVILMYNLYELETHSMINPRQRMKDKTYIQQRSLSLSLSLSLSES